jgi:hypothetical protein
MRYSVYAYLSDTRLGLLIRSILATSLASPACSHMWPWLIHDAHTHTHTHTHSQCESLERRYSTFEFAVTPLLESATTNVDPTTFARLLPVKYA